MLPIEAAVGPLKATIHEILLIVMIFYTYCIALSLAITVMSLRAAGMSRLTMYLQLVGLPYVSNIMNQIEDQRMAIIIKVVFSVVIWGYSAIVLIYKLEWQHIWLYHF